MRYLSAKGGLRKEAPSPTALPHSLQQRRGATSQNRVAH